jgi:hypothetical protein
MQSIMKPIYCLPALIVLIITLLFAQALFAGVYSIPLKHPEEVGRERNCTECHDSADDQFPYAKFNHTLFFGENHGRAASGSQRVCGMCHKESSCSDCHGVRVELKPSLKRHTDSKFQSLHRGDYISRHRIDGRFNPTSCFRCHGSPKTAKTCRPCHR